ncbi:hypothetical protein RRG08_065285 [Elysia crispata]|uniref:Secreted protein n=1 Tax=Elysia crispata TaxID=231223 RepID=A0AAE0YVM0_9GAST|nr:hypothetical protein RRG08_065285 [Elysia crispata]
MDTARLSQEAALLLVLLVCVGVCVCGGGQDEDKRRLKWCHHSLVQCDVIHRGGAGVWLFLHTLYLMGVGQSPGLLTPSFNKRRFPPTPLPLASISTQDLVYS